MAQVSQTVLDAVNRAETDLEAAKAADQAHDAASAALVQAHDAEQVAASAALDAHGVANGSALAAIAALKAELGVA